MCFVSFIDIPLRALDTAVMGRLFIAIDKLLTVLVNIFLGSNLPSKLGSTRTVIFILFFTTLFVYTSYSACIVALIQSNSNSIKSIRDIVESSMTFSAQISPYGKIYFEVRECNVYTYYATMKKYVVHES